MNTAVTQASHEWRHEIDAHEELLFQPGTRLFFAGATFLVMVGSTPERTLVQEERSKDIRTQTQAFLRQAIEEGCVTVLESDESPEAVSLQYRRPGFSEAWIEDIPTSCRSDAAVKVMLEKRNWMRWLEDHYVTDFRDEVALRMKVKELELRYGPCPYEPTTLYKEWLKRKKAHGKDEVHLPKFHLRGGAGGKRLEEEVELIIQKVLRAMEKPESGKIKTSDTRIAIAHAVNALNAGRDALVHFAIPSAPTVKRRLEEHFSAYGIAVRNHGEDKARRLFRENGARVRADHALNIVEYDDTDTCIYAVDERTGLPWGRCWATFGVDQKTQKVTGCAISEDSRSAISAYRAVIHSLLEKDPNHPDLALCKHPWIAYGNQGLAKFDNATYNASNSLQSALIDLGLQYEFARPRHPTNKSSIEHFNHRLKSEFCSKLPGWSGPKEDREALSYGIGTAIMTRMQVVQMMNRWITDDYSNKLLACGYTPNQLWEQDFALHDPFLPERMPSSELVMTISDTLKFRDSGGLLRLGLRYQSPELAEIRRRIGRRAEVRVRYMEDRLDYLYVENPATKHFLKVPCIEDPRVYMHVTNQQQRLIRKLARDRVGHEPNLDELMDARIALVEDTKALMHSKKMHERKRSLHTATLTKPGEFIEGEQKGNRSETVVLSDLEHVMQQIEEEHSMSDEDMTVVSLGDYDEIGDEF